ncbi:MAG: trypsin-like peptidase domain-containing protein [Pirellulales bacterium]|nr:trypsin-like peptidase domain-containing protein [Pirellulales bacterium]
MALLCAMAMCVPLCAAGQTLLSTTRLAQCSVLADKDACSTDQLRLAALWPDWSPPQTPHPAVVRVVAPEGATLSLGSGTLIDKNDEHGLVVTNWHVVRDARGPVEVVFPDGFRSSAKIIRLDRDWDLAALLIAKPPVEPVPLSTAAPKPGDPLRIAGYGSGKYKMQSGRCTQYLSPGGNMPYEMIELSTAARQGDSGGPILNSRGELAGVLFGAGAGTTSGSYGGRVHRFLQLASADLQRLPATTLPPVSNSPGDKLKGPVQLYANHFDSPRAAFAGQIQTLNSAAVVSEATVPRIDSPAPAVVIRADSPVDTQSLASTPAKTWSWGDELQALLAAFGVAAILLQVLRLLSPAKS